MSEVPPWYCDTWRSDEWWRILEKREPEIQEKTKPKTKTNANANDELIYILKKPNETLAEKLRRRAHNRRVNQNKDKKATINRYA